MSNRPKMNYLTNVILVLFGILVLYVFANSPNTCIRCQHSHSCKPPNCVCCSEDMPLTYKEIPQMVFFTFDDAITPQVAGFYRQLFDSSRKNPNGCPVSMTLFISHSNTVYSLVREFYQKGMEIASHSVSHGHPSAATFKDEAKKQKENLARMARIPHTRIKGWRSPFLEPLGDAQPNMLQDLGYSYDATLTISKKTLNEKPPVPFTLDYGWPYDCKIKPCPKQSHRGFWEVPVISLMDYLQRFDCVYVDGCNNPPPDEEAAFRFLWDNFQSYYKTNKAPFGINMHASWFFYPDRLKAMDRFIHELVRLDDVYIVSVKQVIEWLRNPVGLHDIRSFAPWQCENGNSSSSGSNSAFELRNKQIEQRLQELRQQRFEKQELEFLQKHRTWEMQQAARKAAKYSRYSNTNQMIGVPSSGIFPQERSQTSNRRSSAMTWQQMLMAHARKQHANSMPKQSYQYGKTGPNPNMVMSQSVQQINQIAPKRMVRPVSKNSDPKTKEIMLKEQKRIREQQRIAAENRLKEANKLENQKETIKSKDVVASQQTVENQPVNVKQNSQSNPQQTPVLVVRRDRINPQRKSFMNTIIQSSTSSYNVIQPKPLIENKIYNVESRVNQLPDSIGSSLERKMNTIVATKPKIQEVIQEPVQRTRIANDLHKPKLVQYTSRTPVVKYENVKKLTKPFQAEISKNKDNIIGVSKTSLISKPLITASKPAKISRVQLVGGSWNPFDMNTKIPWKNWFIQADKKGDSKPNTNVVTNGHSGKLKQNDFEPKPPHSRQVTQEIIRDILKEKKPEQKGNILFSTKPPKTVYTTTNIQKPVILSKVNTTGVENAVKTNIKSTQTGHEMSNSALIECQQNVNCFLPDCFCMTNTNPFEMKTHEIPQIVYVTIEGEMNFLSYSKLRSLFTTQRVNPNGCHIGSTFFVSDKGTSYSLARNLQRYGMEIAMNGINKDGYDNIQSLKSDLDRQIGNIIKQIGDKTTKLTGWRSPKLKIVGDEQFKLLENKTIYDSSIALKRSMKSWPFTLDFGLNQFCFDNHFCQFYKHPGVWEIPIVPVLGFNHSEHCLYADGCSKQPISTDDTYEYLMRNFEKYYHGNRAPFGIHLTQKWFHWNYSKNLAGLSKFFDSILENKDVYMTSISDMIQWIKNPTTVSSITKSDIWNC